MPGNDTPRSISWQLRASQCPHPGGRPTDIVTAGRFSRARPHQVAPSAPGSSARASSRSTRLPRPRRATRRISTPSRPTSSGPPRPPPLYLHTSPEFAMKKLLAAGEEKIFAFAPVFRNRERGALHHPEFTMLEWYRAGAAYAAVMADAAALLKLAAETADNRFFSFRGTHVEPARRTRAPDRGRSHEPLRRRRSPRHRLTPRPRSRGACRHGEAQGVTARPDDTWSDLFAKLLTALSSRSSASAARRCSPSIRRARRPWLAQPPPIRALPSASSSIAAASSWPTASASSPTPTSSAGGSGTDGREGAHLRRPLSASTRISSPPSPICRRPRDARSASTAWSCWRPAPSASSR